MAQRRAAEAEAKAQAGAAEAEAKAQAGVAEAQALAQADAGADEAGVDEAGADEADAGAYEAEAQAQADAGAYEAQLHQLQPELQQREQQATDTQRLQHLQQQLQDLLQEELQRKTPVPATGNPMPMFQDTVKEVYDDEVCYALLMWFHPDLLHDEVCFGKLTNTHCARYCQHMGLDRPKERRKLRRLVVRDLRSEQLEFEYEVKRLYG
ncbi:hypothetical protein QJQ45_009622 [Haematococcus lacustris]|nr:hypothetical protein QJQ45_009622 [Haematococcus lacustris]